MSGNGDGGGMGSTRKKPRAVETMITPQQWIYETIFEHCYPRIDINVSTHQVRGRIYERRFSIFHYYCYLDDLLLF